MHRLVFPDRRRKTFLIGEIIHSDVCGPMSYTSMGGARYFVLYKEDFTGFVTIYFMKRKYKVFAYFRLFTALVKNQTGKDISTLRTDGGGEYNNTEFKRYLEERGIRHESSCPHTPAQNGVAERANRTVMESDRSMIHSSNAPLWLRTEAVAYAV